MNSATIGTNMTQAVIPFRNQQTDFFTTGTTKIHYFSYVMVDVSKDRVETLRRPGAPPPKGSNGRYRTTDTRFSINNQL
jgi:hypothetical protein